MGKYTPLTGYLRASGRPSVRLTYEQLDQLVDGLPPSARLYRAWWGNQTDIRTRPHARAWQEAGYAVDSVDLYEEVVMFRQS